MTQPNAAPPATETRVDAQMVTRQLLIRSETFNPEANTVDVVFTTGARGTRFSWARYEQIDEELSTDASAVRLDRLNRGAPVLNTHRSYELANQIGVVVPGSARMEGGEGIATLQLSSRDDVKPIAADIAAGIIRNVSVGYLVHTFEITENEGQRALYRAVDWEPYEISFVPMPFDVGAQVRSAEPAQGGHPCIIRRTSPAAQETTMTTAPTQPTGDNPADPSTRAPDAVIDVTPTNVTTQQRQAPATVTVAAIRTASRNAGLTDDATFELIERHEATPLTNDALMADIGRRFAERDSSAPTNSRISVTRDAGDTQRRGMEEAILHRMTPRGQLAEVGRAYRGMSLLRMAEEHLAAAGVNVRGMSANEIAERALHTSSDFANLVGNGLHRRLRAAYDENQPSYRLWARRAPNAPDFRSIDIVQMSAMPDLVKTNEAGEFRYGTATDGKVSYGIATYGRIIAFSRQLLINDDLRALERVATGFAAAGARLENRTVYAQITSNPVMPDGIPLFHADHGNLGTGAISPTSLAAMRKDMRLQKGLQKEELNLMPEHLLVPATQEQLAYQYTSSQFVPAKATDVNEFRAGGRTALDPVVEAVLDGNSTSAWYGAASNAQVDTVEYAYLEGSEGVQMSSRMGFTVDGVEMKASLDFAAAVIDHRGLWKSAG
ncbi:prohead protease/major capsid protein fusion protein [Sphingomonas solaris]|uniref:Peptidase U37 n=1 Tax=Alterirhizorhabdus solaris TaxID=2529389 RepID=A0A558R8C4_9SPHN|nr:prohead protease/major capsid protein fusion protein [Sphingomonas solaris]TVV75552.1 peptidase U37 [Sphingomonas solaris]